MRIWVERTAIVVARAELRPSTHIPMLLGEMTTRVVDRLPAETAPTGRYLVYYKKRTVCKRRVYKEKRPAFS